MRVRLTVLSGIAYLLALTSCDTARNLVEPIDDAPIEKFLNLNIPPLL